MKGEEKDKEEIKRLKKENKSLNNTLLKVANIAYLDDNNNQCDCQRLMAIQNILERPFK